MLKAQTIRTKRKMRIRMILLKKRRRRKKKMKRVATLFRRIVLRILGHRERHLRELPSLS